MMYLNSVLWQLDDVELAIYHPCDRLFSRIAFYLTGIPIYHANGDIEVLSDGDVLSIPALFPAWKLPGSILWTSESQPVFNSPI